MADRTAIVAQTQQVQTTTGIASDATALAANVSRGAFIVQNLGQNVLFVKLGAGASTSSFTIALKAGSANDDGTGGVFSMGEGVVYIGVVTVAGSSPRYVATEL